MGAVTGRRRITVRMASTTARGCAPRGITRSAPGISSMFGDITTTLRGWGATITRTRSATALASTVSGMSPMTTTSGTDEDSARMAAETVLATVTSKPLEARNSS